MNSIPSAFKKHLILALPIQNETALLSHLILEQYGYILLDAPLLNGQLGGRGALSNWDLARKLAKDYNLIRKRRPRWIYYPVNILGSCCS